MTLTVRFIELSPSCVLFGASRGFVTFFKSNAKALFTLRIKSALRSPRGKAACGLLATFATSFYRAFPPVKLLPLRRLNHARNPSSESLMDSLAQFRTVSK